MEITILAQQIESLIFASDKPLSTAEIQNIFNNSEEENAENEKLSLEDIESALQIVTEKYSSEQFPFEVKQSGGGWQFLTKSPFHKTISLLQNEKKIKKLSPAAMEVLAIIAYKNPITRSEIESIRTVNCDYAIQKLLDKDLIVICGRHDEQPGQPLLYTVSNTFLDYFGINSTDELPAVNEIANEQILAPTIANYTPTSDTLENTDFDIVSSEEQAVSSV